MLIRFKSEVGGFVMFGDVALKLLRMSGHSAAVPGAIDAEGMAPALARLEAQVLAQTPPGEEPGDGTGQQNDDDGGDANPPVSLAQRAFPMIELMRRAIDEQCAIQWLED
jgi:hypothetical protein